MNQTAEMNENMEKMCQWMTIGMKIASDPSLMNELVVKRSRKASNNKKKHRKSGYAVQDEELLYKLADAGLLCKLHGVNSKTEPRIYYFDEDFDVKTIVDDFKKSDIKASDDHDELYTGIIKAEGGLGIIPN